MHFWNLKRMMIFNTEAITCMFTVCVQALFWLYNINRQFVLYNELNVRHALHISVHLDDVKGSCKTWNGKYNGLNGFCAIVPLIHQHTYEKHPSIRFLDRNPPLPSAPGEEALQINATRAFPSICVRSPLSLLLYPSNTVLAFWEASREVLRCCAW